MFYLATLTGWGGGGEEETWGMEGCKGGLGARAALQTWGCHRANGEGVEKAEGWVNPEGLKNWGWVRGGAG